MLTFDPSKAPVRPKHAASVIIARDDVAGPQVFCVRRHAKSAFLGGAVVFPGGKLDASDADEAWQDLANAPHPRAAAFADGVAPGALALCGSRETLEEAALLATLPSLRHEAVLAMQRELNGGADFRALLEQRGAVVDRAALVPFARWVTPEAESRRYDARFFILRAPDGQHGHHDEHETTMGIWATAAQMLEAHHGGHVFLAPPTLRIFELLGKCGDVEAVLAASAEQSLAPICPKFVPGDEPYLALPGDPAHDVHEPCVAGPTRFTLRDGRFVSG